MKKIITLLFVLMLAVVSVFAQAPQKMSYQAVVRNANNTLVSDQNVSVRISVLQGSATGSAVYVETHNVTTNVNGLMTVEVGTGLPVNGAFDQINWGQGPFYLKSEIDPEGGINYSIEGVQQLLSVPYALYAARAGNVPSVAVVPTANGYDIIFNGQTFHIENCTSPTVTANQDPTTGDVTLTINNNDGTTPTNVTIPAGQDGNAPTVTANQNPTTGDVTLTINNNDGSTPTNVTIPAGQPGPQGVAGQNGVSPTISATQNPTTGDVLLIINNNDGSAPSSVTIPAGQDGAVGPQGIPGADGLPGTSPTVTATQNTTGDVTLTINNNDGTTPTTVTIPAGQNGTPGLDGTSPTVTSTQDPTTGNVTLTINNNDGTPTTTVTIPAGQNGTPGLDGTSPTVTSTQDPTTGNVTLTINNNDGTTPTTVTIPAGRDGVDGHNGADGLPGTSPTVTATQNTTGDVTLTVNNNDGTTPTTVTIPAGQNGTPGLDGTSPTVTSTQDPTTGNVTLTINNNDGTPTTTVTIPAGRDGVDGHNGADGLPGTSPTVTATQNTTGDVTLTIDNNDGTTPTNVMIPAGQQGVPGQDGNSPTVTANQDPTTGNVTLTIDNNDGTTPTNVMIPAGRDGNSPTVTANQDPTTGNVTLTIDNNDGTAPTNVTIPAGQGGSGDNVPQLLTIDSNVLSITNGNSVILPYFPQQTITISGDTIFLSDGGQVVLPNLTDDDIENIGDYMSGFICGQSKVADHEGNVYNTVKIGNQCWTKENMRAHTSPSTGTNILRLSHEIPSYSGKKAYYPNNDPSNEADYGLLYNWNAVVDTFNTTLGETSTDSSANAAVDVEFTGNRRGICPQGWHVPVMSEWSQLTQYVGSQSEYVCGNNPTDIAKALAAKTLWQPTYGSDTLPCTPSNDLSTNNATGFSAVPAAFLESIYFYRPGTEAYFWSANQVSAQECGHVYIGSYYRDILFEYSTDKHFYFSVRCLRDNGVSGNPTDNETAANVGPQGPQGEPGRDAEVNVTTNPVTDSTGRTGTEMIITTNDGYQSVIVWDGEDGNDATYHSAPIVLTDRNELRHDTATVYGWVLYPGTEEDLGLGIKIGTDTNNFSDDYLMQTGREYGNNYYKITVNGLQPNTTYYYYAYASNAYGLNKGMTKSFTTASTFADAIPCPDAPTVTDIDGNVYNTVQIGNQCWMKEDLRTTKYASGSPLYNGFSSIRPEFQINNGNYLYNSYAALLGQKSTVENNQGICPSGWHIPSVNDWNVLNRNTPIDELLADGNNHSGFSAVNTGIFIGQNFRNISEPDYATTKAEVNPLASAGYSFYSYSLPTGEGHTSYGTRYVPVRCIKGQGVTFAPTVVLNDVTEIMSNEALGEWTITSDGGELVTMQGLCWNTTGNPTINDQVSNYTDTVFGSNINYNGQMMGLEPSTTYYVRAFATNANGTVYSDSVITFTTPIVMNIPCPDAATVTDYDGNIYNTVQIGDQCWMKENLRTTHTNTGAEIAPYQPAYTNPKISENDPMYYVPGNSGHYYFANAYTNGLHVTTNEDLVQGVCPAGWHLPTIGEWRHLYADLNATHENVFDVLFTSGSNITGFSAEMLPLVTYWSIGYDQLGFRLADGYVRIVDNQLYDNLLSLSSDGRMISGGQLVNVVASPVRCIKGEGITFPPTVVLERVSAITSDQAAGEWMVPSDGGKPVTQHGICWNTTGNPTTNDQTSLSMDTIYGNGYLHFINAITDLQPSTTYYVRAFATNANGTVYSDSVFTFTTPVMMNRPCPDAPTVTDVDSNIYNTVQIGNQCWMKENLRAKHYVSGSEMFGINQESFMPRYYEVGDNVLYSRQAAINNSTQGICPQGWRLPTRDEYLTLFNVLGGMEAAFPKLISTSGWNVPNATNESGFSLPYVPNRYYSHFYQTLSTETDVTLLTASEYFTIDLENTGISLRGDNAYFNSVRCIKGEGRTGLPKIRLDKVKARGANEGEYRAYISSDGSSPILSSGIEYGTSPNNLSNRNDSGPTHITIYSQNFRGLEPNTTYYVRAFATNANGTAYSDSILSFTTPIIMNVPCSDAPTVTDYDGNVYQTVQVGEQCWMKENLKTTHYATGAELTEYNSNNNIRSQYYPKYFSGDNGYYYDYMGMMNGNDRAVGNQGICPDGWHIPAFTEYTELFNALGGQNVAYDKIMATRSNESGLSFRLDGGYFLNGYHGDFMILRSSNASHQYKISDNNITALGGDAYYSPVRCIKNTGAAVTGLPTIAISDTVRDLTSISNDPGAYIVYDGGKSITEFGWQYGVSTSDLTTDRFQNHNNTACPLPFGSRVQPLQPNTTYYLRGFATNENGTAYTDFVTFTTPAMMNLPCPDAATVTDYDGNVYNTVMIGNQCWTKEDMKTTHYATGSQIENSVRNFGRLPGYYNYGNDNGKLYDHRTINNGYTTLNQNDSIQGICPNGWHVPSSSEIQEMINTLGGLQQAASMLKSTQGWTTPGTNESGFNAIPCGYYSRAYSQYISGEFLMKSSTLAFGLLIDNQDTRYVGETNEYASARCVKGQGIATEPVLDSVSISELTPESAYTSVMVDFDGNSTITELGICLGTSQNPTQEEDYTNNSTDNAYFRLTTLEPNTTYYIRAYAKYGNNSIAYGPDCSFTTPAVVMNTACPDAPMVSDMDGNWYNTVQIGNQCWMKENLRTTTFANGDAISSDTMNAKFYTLPTNSGYMAARYGLFYSWDAIMNGAPGNYGAPVQGICPSGWHVPSKNEWVELNNNLQGGFNSATAIMLRENSNFWNDGGGNNQTGMSIRPAGYLGYYNNTSTQFGSRTEFYTADMSDADNVFYVYFSGDYYNIASQSPNEYLSSVRCIKGEGATVFPPRIEIIGYTPHTYNTATIEVKVINNGGGITRYGIYITDNPNEHFYFAQYASHQYGTNNIQSGETFSFTMNGVVPFNDDRVKYAVAYAINEMDTVYSEPMQIVIMNVPCQTSTVTDASGNSYNTVQIDKQCWMKENLRTTKYPSGANIETCDGSNTRYYKHVNNSANNDAVYGLHYTWAAAMNGAPDNYSQPVQGICPNGWHIPTRAELETLKATVNNDMNALKNTQYWSSTGPTNTSGFSLNPSGYSQYSCSTTSSSSVGSSSELMTANSSSSNSYYYFNASGSFSTNGKTSYMDAVRCIKGDGANVFAPEVQTVGHTQNTYSSVKVTGKIVADNGAITSKGICYSNSTSMPTISDSKVTSSANTSEFACTLTGLIPAKTYYARAYATNSAGTAYGSVDTIKIMNVSCSSTSVSYNGHSYPTVQIGGQCWLKENLRTTKGTNGTDLDYAWDFDGTYYADNYTYVYWNHSSSNASRGLLYGRNYAGETFFSTSTTNQSGLRGLCPSGWHVPSKAEVNELTSFLGGSSVAGKKLKSTTGWSTPGTNESGFNMTATGYFQASTSTFQFGTTNAYFWMTDGQGSSYLGAGCSNSGNEISFFTRNTGDQMPIRCLRDGATFTNISGVQTSGPSNSYNYRVTASFSKNTADNTYGYSPVVECGIEGQDGQRITSSSTSSIDVTVSFPGYESGYPYRCYIKTAAGKYYYSENHFLEGFIVN